MLLTLCACGTAGLQDIDERPDKPQALDSGDPVDSEDSAPVDPEETADTGEVEDSSPPDDSETVPPDPRRIWLLPQSDKVWTERQLDVDGSPNAPVEPIQAAFGIPDIDRLWVLTASSYHVLRTDTWAWVDSGDRDGFFPDVAGEAVNSAEVVPAWWGGTTLASIYIQVDETAWIYTYDVDTDEIALSTTVSLDATWSGTLGPPAERITAGWLAVDETAGWAPGSPATVCDVGDAEMAAYLLLLSDAGTAHTYDAGYCFDFVDARPAENLSVFTYTGAPDPADVVAIDWTGSVLVAFTET